MAHPPVVLAVGGLDPTGLAGLAADLRAGAALGALVAPVAAALTVQGQQGVAAVQAVDPALLQRQLRAALESLPVGAVKLGLLPSAAQWRAVAQVLEERAALPVVMDPVLGATRGGSLVQPDLLPALKSGLARVDLLTPNLPEAGALLGRSLSQDRGSLETAARDLRALGPQAVLLKGGHLDSAASPDLLAGPEGLHWLEGARVDTPNTRGTGCTLATLIAVGLARGLELAEACAEAKKALGRLLILGQAAQWPLGPGPVGLA